MEYENKFMGKYQIIDNKTLAKMSNTRWNSSKLPSDAWYN